MTLVLVENEGSKIHEFHRLENGKPVHKTFNFKPYFFYQNEKGAYRTLMGERASRVVARKPSDIKFLRERFTKTYEDDVVYTNRFIIDRYYDKAIKETDLRRWYLDIEVDDTRGYDIIKTYESPITSITLYDSYKKLYITLLNDRDIERKNKKEAVKPFKTEVELLEFFVKLVKNLNPDMITAWNISFDMPYIIERMKKLGMNPDDISRMGSTILTEDMMKVKGRVTLDMLQAYKKMTFNQLSSYALDFVARQELNETKEKYKGKIQDMDDEKFLKYNQRDVELLVLLDEKLHITEFFDTIRRIAKVNFHDVFSNKRVVDGFVLTKAKKENIVLPAVDRNAKRVKFEGAFVKQPPQGLHKYVSAFDFKSLYPSIIMQFNMSYETFIYPSDVGKFKEEDVISIDGKYHFRKDIKGFASSIMEELMDLRTKYKRLMKKATDRIEEKSYNLMQAAVKVIMNSYYGVTTSPFFRLFRPQVGAAITHCGRRLIKKAEEFVQDKMGFEVVIIDTDSVYAKTCADGPEEGLKVSQEIHNKMENIWTPFLEQFNAHPNRKIIMEHEKMYERLLTIGVKKRYAGHVIWKDGSWLKKKKLDTKGMSTVRSDFPLMAQKFLKEMLTRILEGRSQKDCDDYIKSFKEEFKKGDVMEIGFPTSIKSKEAYKNNPMQKRAAENSEKWLDIPYIGGSKIRYYFIKKTPDDIPYDNVFVFDGEIPEGFELDWKKTFQRIVGNPLEPIYESIGWNKNKLHDPGQTGLNEWW